MVTYFAKSVRSKTSSPARFNRLRNRDCKWGIKKKIQPTAQSRIF